MGDHGQSFTRTDLGVDDARGLAVDIHAWLLAEGVISVDDVSTLRGVGHGPGSRWSTVIEPGWVNDENFLGLKSNGARIEGGVPYASAYPNGGNLASACPSCAGDLGGEFQGALNAWVKWKEPDPRPTFVCPTCELAIPVDEAVLNDSWSLSLIEVTFENWGRLSETFRAKMLSRLGGNSRYVWGKH